MAANKPISLGCIGAGAIAAYTLREFSRCQGVQITAIADTNNPRAHQLASEQGVNSVYESAEALCADDSIDAVYIAVPNALHMPVATMALTAGKQVLLDKPFALTLAEAESMVALAKQQDRVLMLGMNHRFDPSVQRARWLVQQGKLGGIYHAKAQWTRRSGIPRMGSWFTHQAMAGGGALLDIGVHVLDATLYILDCFEPLTVSGQVATRFGNRGLGEGGWGKSDREYQQFDVDDFASAFIRLRNAQGDTIALTLDVSWASHRADANQTSINLFGDDAGLSVYEQHLFRSGQDGYQIVQDPTAEVAHPQASRAAHFVSVLRGEEEMIVKPEHALTVQRILDGIYASASTGSEVNLNG